MITIDSDKIITGECSDLPQFLQLLGVPDASVKTCVQFELFIGEKGVTLEVARYEGASDSITREMFKVVDTNLGHTYSAIPTVKKYLGIPLSCKVVALKLAVSVGAIVNLDIKLEMTTDLKNYDMGQVGVLKATRVNYDSFE